MSIRVWTLNPCTGNKVIIQSKIQASIIGNLSESLKELRLDFLTVIRHINSINSIKLVSKTFTNYYQNSSLINQVKIPWFVSVWMYMCIGPCVLRSFSSSVSRSEQVCMAFNNRCYNRRKTLISSQNQQWDRQKS